MDKRTEVLTGATLVAFGCIGVGAVGACVWIIGETLEAALPQPYGTAAAVLGVFAFLAIVAVIVGFAVAPARKRS